MSQKKKVCAVLGREFSEAEKSRLMLTLIGYSFALAVLTVLAAVVAVRHYPGVLVTVLGCICVSVAVLGARRVIVALLPLEPVAVEPSAWLRRWVECSSR